MTKVNRAKKFLEQRDKVVFSVIFFLTFVYEVARGGLEWGPLHVSRDLSDDAAMVSAARSSSSTIRRVGLEGRPDRVAAEVDATPDQNEAA